MQVLLTLIHHGRNGAQTLHFGRPNTPQEVERMHQLRYHVYVEQKGYIPASLCPLGLEIDQIDQKGGCHYFIAHCNEHLVGTVRLIQQDPLPLRQYYWRFEAPAELEGVPPSQVVEVGRLIASYRSGISFPVHLVPLGLVSCVVHLATEQAILAGYANLKVRIARQLARSGMPVRQIHPSACIYDEQGEDPLKHYFADPTDPSCPTYFLREEMRHFYDHLFRRSSRFQQIAEDAYLYLPSGNGHQAGRTKEQESSHD